MNAKFIIIPHEYKQYRCKIEFYYKALDINDALGAADEFAGFIEKNYDGVEAKVFSPIINKK